jgi:hypothetical protein
VRPLLVVMADVGAEDVFELAASDDKQPVEALPPDAADPSAPCGRLRSGPGRACG